VLFGFERKKATIVATIPMGNNFMTSDVATSDPDPGGLINGIIVAITIPEATKVTNVITICFFMCFGAGGFFAELLFDNNHHK